MKHAQSNKFLAVSSAVALAAISSSALAANITKANNSDALESGTSWTGGVAPTGTGTAFFDAATVSTAGNRTGNLGTDVTWGTIRADGGTGAFAVNSGGGNTITLNGTTDASARLDSILLNSAAGPSLTIGANLALGTNNTFFTSSRSLTINGDINLGANTLKLFPAGPNSVIEMNGLVSGSAASNVNALFTDQNTGTGTIRLTNASNSFTGRIELGSTATGMRLEFTSAGALGNTSEIRFRNTGGTAGLGSMLRYTGTTNQTISQTIQCDTSVGIRIESNSIGGSLTFNGAFNQSNRPLFLGGTGAGENTLATGYSGNGGLTKRDAGTWVLNAVNNYTGATSVTGGKLIIGATGSLGNTTTTIGTSGTLAGGGSIGGATTIEGIHSPGFSPGTQTFTNNLSYASTSTLNWELNDNTTAGRGTAYDAVNVSGGSFSLASGATIDLSFIGTVDFLDAFWGLDQEWMVVDLSGSATAADSNLFSIGAITGGANYSPLLGSFGITRKDGSSTEDSVYLTWTAIPEPSTALLGGIGLLMLFRRRR